ncbi:sugar transferase [Crateriforma conspicua]|uniref:Putative sugar transferase EpsL n=1 Tax=Crateriforma conspicua TaxID=2527996 RepID=A0A5C5Y6P5_9PLAN|nr:sugar transferase [Crateriforma conspicua]QDV64913.1 putative sugar transferase EpsL [Crateriforma conspicua]TWT70311.1 putative sugar transferase EpsL [Crateriforma conspicua]
MLGALIQYWSDRRVRRGRNGESVLTRQQFNHELTRERIRATRRSIPFCLLNVELTAEADRSNNRRKLVRLLNRNLRITDQIGQLNRNQFGVLLVDTPEMGGRACLDRLTRLFDGVQLDVRLSLRVHDPEGFDSDDDYPGDGDRRGETPTTRQWSPETDAGPVEVSTESPMTSGKTIQSALKRSVDVIGASVGLILTGPIILGSMAAVKLTSPGPAMFTQTREGYRGRPFTIYKLRTMIVDAESQQAALREQSHRDGPAFKIERDPRVTSVGHLFRVTCIDELPQLWNVLKGDMSLVGPRPLPWHESRACSHWHRRRLDVKPGMTCYWQVDKEAAETFDDWMRMDLRYVDRTGLLGDFRLIAQTVTVPILGRGSR